MPVKALQWIVFTRIYTTMCRLIELADLDISDFLCSLSLEDTTPKDLLRFGLKKRFHVRFFLLRKFLKKRLDRKMAVHDQVERSDPESSGIDIEGQDCLITEEDKGVFEADLETPRLGGSPIYSLCTTVKIMRETLSIEVRSRVLKGGRLLQVKSPAVRLLLCRYLNRLNAALFEGSIVISPHNGTIVHRLYHHFSVSDFDRIMTDLNHALALLEEYIEIAQGCFSYNLHKILYLADEVSEEDINKLIQQGERIRPLCPSLNQLVGFIERAIDLSLYDFDFMFDWRLGRDISETVANRICQASKDQMDKSQKITLRDKQRLDGINQKLAGFNTSEMAPIISYDSEKDNLRQYRQRLIKLLTKVKVRSSHYLEKIGVLSLIHLFSEESSKWRARTGGGFSLIDVADCLYTFLSDPNDEAPRTTTDCKHVFRKVLARKAEKQLEEGKIYHEKRILSQIRNQTSANVCRFYESNQEQFKESLFMIYCEYSDYSGFKRVRKTVMSLLMRLYFLSQFVEGLRFLHSHHIFHLDLKPQNLLIGKAFILKITDFGESYHPSVCTQDYRPGYTPPYAAPESRETPIPFSERFDIYSFGVILYETLFDMLPVQVSRTKAQQIVNSCRMDKFRDLVYGLPERSSDFGPKRLIGMLFMLSLHCMSKEASKRPRLDWIQIILKDSISYLEGLY